MTQEISGRQLLDELLANLEWHDTPKRRESFVYMLGVYAHSARSGNKADCRLERVVEREASRERISKAIKLLTKRRIDIDKTEIRLQCSELVNLLDCGFFDDEAFYSMVWTERDRVNLLQGYFANDRPKPSATNGNYRFTIVAEEVVIKKLLWSFLGIGIYPNISADGRRILITDTHGISLLLKNNIVQEEGQRKTLNDYLARVEHRLDYTPSQYYSARSSVAEMVKQKQPIDWKSLAERLGIRSGDTIQKWTSDLAGLSDSLKCPDAVRRYEKVLQRLQLPNPYLAEEPVNWQGHWLYPLKGEFYELTPTAQKMYFQWNGVDEKTWDADDAKRIFANLKRQLGKDGKNDLRFTIKRSQVTTVSMIRDAEEKLKVSTNRSGHQGNWADAIYC